jgi:propionyl-CoA synthetase
MSPHPLLPEASDGELGPLVFRLPLPPGAFTTLLNDSERYESSYMRRFPGYCEAGDAAVRDQDGYIHIMARTDDVLNVAGHRLSTGAMEEAIAQLECVAESAVIGPYDDLKGQLPVALVVLKTGRDESWAQVAELAAAKVRSEVGPVASLRPGQVVVVDRLPKTRSGKVLRATMKAIADGTPHKVPATIDDPAILDEIRSALHTIGYAPTA